MGEIIPMTMNYQDKFCKGWGLLKGFEDLKKVLFVQ
jgi:hypothetical protein